MLLQNGGLNVNLETCTCVTITANLVPVICQRLNAFSSSIYIYNGEYEANHRFNCLISQLLQPLLL